MSRVRINISVTPDTAERLKEYAYEQHKTVSQVITDWTWKSKIKDSQIKGQISFEDWQKGERQQTD